MQPHWNLKATLLLGLAIHASTALGSGAFAAEALPDRPGFGYTIQFTPGATAEGLLPVRRQALPDRPGFGYAINFVPSDPKDSLYPPGWAKQRSMAIASASCAKQMSAKRNY